MRKQYSGQFDYRQKPPLFDPPALRREIHQVGIVTLNGQEVKQVWFADTEEGVVKTYDVFRDGKAYSTRTSFEGGSIESFGPEDFPGREVDCPLGGALSETLRGKVQLWGPERVSGDGRQ